MEAVPVGSGGQNLRGRFSPWIWDVRGEVITLQAKVEYRQVLKVLQNRWGKRGLFAALYAARGSGAALYPLSDDVHDQVFSTNSTPGMRSAWEWYDAGASIER
jgi:hypothetical protein